MIFITDYFFLAQGSQPGPSAPFGGPRSGSLGTTSRGLY